MSYEIVDVDALGRIGKFELNKKKMITSGYERLNDVTFYDFISVESR